MNLTQEQYVVDASGAKTAVILSIEQYEQLLEDLHDLAIVAERRSEQPNSVSRRMPNPYGKIGTPSTGRLKAYDLED